MSKAADKRREQGFYGPRRRTKPTVRELGPRDPGPHGKTQPKRKKMGTLINELIEVLPK